jgi:hypothetical protein
MMRKKIIVFCLALLFTILSVVGYYFHNKHQATRLYEQAEKVYQEEEHGQALVIYKDLKQKYFSYLTLSDKIILLFHMGSCFYFDDEWDLAIPVLDEGMKIMEKNNLYDQDYASGFYSRLGKSFFYKDETLEAEKILLKGYDTIRHIYGKKSWGAGLMAARLGEVYSGSYNYKKSLPYWIEAIENEAFMDSQRGSGKALLYVYIASAYSFNEQYADAEKYSEMFFTYALKNSDEYSVLTAFGYASSAMIYYRQYKKAKAISLLNKSYTIYKKISGDDSYCTRRVKKLLDEWSSEEKVHEEQ